MLESTGRKVQRLVPLCVNVTWREEGHRLLFGSELSNNDSRRFADLCGMLFRLSSGIFTPNKKKDVSEGWEGVRHQVSTTDFGLRTAFIENGEEQEGTKADSSDQLKPN